MSQKVVYVRQGTSCMFPLFLIFLVLKLTGVIAWSWWFVTMPLWISLALGLTLFVAIAAVGMLILMVAGIAGMFT